MAGDRKEPYAKAVQRRSAEPIRSARGMVVRMHKTPIPGLHAAAAIAMIVGCTLILFGPFEHKIFLLFLLPAAFLFGHLVRGEYRRGVRAIDTVRDKYLPVAEKRIRAAQILADWRGTDADEVRAAIDQLVDEELAGIGPVEIACRAARYMEPPE